MVQRASRNNGAGTEGGAGGEGELVARAVAGDRHAFERLVVPYRRELHVHCYRMLGVLHEAEDLVQDTLLRAWQGLGGFEQRSSLRAWLYKIATNTCLNQLRKRPRVVVPAEYQPSDPTATPRSAEVPWLEPYPDRLLEPADPAADPAEQTSRRMDTSLAFLTAVQLLSARQRAVLILRDVLAFSGAEVARLLDTTPVAVDSALRRARRRLADDARQSPPLADRPPASEDEQVIVDRFVAAWERADIAGLVALLAEDAVLAMPPTPAWFRGRAAIGEFFATVPADGHFDQIRLVGTRGNGLPALAAYIPDPDLDGPDPDTPSYRAYGIMLFAVDAEGITEITGFPGPHLFADFGLPDTLT